MKGKNWNARLTKKIAHGYFLCLGNERTHSFCNYGYFSALARMIWYRSEKKRKEKKKKEVIYFPSIDRKKKKKKKGPLKICDNTTII